MMLMMRMPIIIQMSSTNTTSSPTGKRSFIIFTRRRASSVNDWIICFDFFSLKLNIDLVGDYQDQDLNEGVLVDSTPLYSR